jgi:hypothetical protein
MSISFFRQSSTPDKGSGKEKEKGRAPLPKQTDSPAKQEPTAPRKSVFGSFSQLEAGRGSLSKGRSVTIEEEVKSAQPVPELKQIAPAKIRRAEGFIPVFSRRKNSAFRPQSSFAVSVESRSALKHLVCPDAKVGTFFSI